MTGEKWLSEHADHIKTLGKFISPPKNNNNTKTPTKKPTSFQTKPVCQSLSVKNCCLWVWVEYFALSVRESFFFLFAIKKSQFSKDMSGGEGLKNMLPFCVCEELDPYMIFCLAHFQNLQQLSKVTEFNTDLNTRDRQTSSNVCLLKLKEKQ